MDSVPRINNMTRTDQDKALTEDKQTNIPYYLTSLRFKVAFFCLHYSHCYMMACSESYYLKELNDVAIAMEKIIVHQHHKPSVLAYCSQRPADMRGSARS